MTVALVTLSAVLGALFVGAGGVKVVSLGRSILIRDQFGLSPAVGGSSARWRRPAESDFSSGLPFHR